MGGRLLKKKDMHGVGGRDVRRKEGKKRWREKEMRLVGILVLVLGNRKRGVVW